MDKGFLLEHSIEQLEASVIITDRNGIIRFVNPHFVKNTGFTSEEAIGNTPNLISSGMQPPSFYKKMWDTITSGKTWSGELQNKRKNGELFWERVSISPVLDEQGKIEQYIAIYQDISKEKKTREELSQKERLLTNVEEISKTGGWEYDLEIKKIYWTDELYRIHGFKKNQEIDFIQESLKCYNPEDVEIVENAFNKLIETGKGYDLTLRFRSSSGEFKWVRTKSEALFDKKGKVKRVFGSVKDVTKEYEKNKELEETKTRLEYALKGTDAGYWDWDVRTGECIFNDRWANMLGYSLDELLPHNVETWESLTHPEDLKLAYAEHKKYLNGVIPIYEMILRMKHKKGHWIWVFVRGAAFGRDKDGNPSRMVGTHVDISERMNIRFKLEASEKRYRTLFEESTDPSLIFENRVIKDCNLATVKLLGYNTKEELIGKTLSDISPKEIDGIPALELADRNLQQSNEKGHARSEWVHKRKDGSLVPVEVSATPIYDYEDTDEKVHYVVWRDITKRKETEKKLVTLYEERGVLLAEIHHRVKNNLAIISGLMQLQIFRSEDAYINEALTKSVNRISAIAHMHELLYVSENFVNISVTENIRKQIEQLQEMYKSSRGPNIEIKLDLEEVDLNINQALPFGLLVNEILNNAYKHAFKERENGIISIKLKEQENRVSLNIKDNGIGMNRNNEEPTLGETLIDNFLKQLDAEVILETENGLFYDIVFDKTNTQGSSINKIIDR